MTSDIRPPAPHGILVLDKPRGPTSHDVVARVRRALGVRQVGHAGTLDPMATGVLVVAIGEATKLVPWLVAQDKSYEATISLGVETDTLDADGQEVRRVPPSDELREALGASGRLALAPELRAALATEIARTEQIPPAFSAVKLAGERAYARARRGEPTMLAARSVQVRRLEILSCLDDPPLIAVALQVSKGYYVRSLARDLPRALGTVGHLTSLRRTASGCFSSGEALSLETPAEELVARMHTLPHAAARALPVAGLTDSGARDARHGRRVSAGDVDGCSHGPSAWLDPRGDLVAVGEIDENGTGKVLRGFTSRVPESAHP